MTIRGFKVFAMAWAIGFLCFNFAVAQDESGQDSKGDSAQKQEELSQGDAIRAAIKDEKWDEAAQLIDQSAKAGISNDVELFRQQLINGLLRARKTEPAYEQIKLLFNEQMATVESEAIQRRIASTLSQALTFSRGAHNDEVLGMANQLIDALKAKIDDSKYSPAMETFVQAILVKARLAEPEDAKKLLDEQMSKVDSLVEINPDSVEAAMLKANLMTQMMNTSSGDEAAELFSSLDSFLAAQSERHPENSAVIGRYIANRTSRISRLARQDAETASAILTETREKVAEAIKDNPDFEKSLSNFERTFTSLERTIESSLKLAKLVGKPAPMMDPEFWANGENVSLESLKGKVVLLDFWAVWCGPCIATFPHLKHWQEAYGDDGFQIVGVTRPYQYKWDDEADRAVKAEEVSIEDELAMLNKFMAKHELKHPTMVTPTGSSMNSDFAVSGIPHAVLIDQQGVIRLIKVGSGEKNASEIESMIKQLLGK